MTREPNFLSLSGLSVSEAVFRVFSVEFSCIPCVPWFPKTKPKIKTLENGNHFFPAKEIPAQKTGTLQTFGIKSAGVTSGIQPRLF